MRLGTARNPATCLMTISRENGTASFLNSGSLLSLLWMDMLSEVVWNLRWCATLSSHLTKQSLDNQRSNLVSSQAQEEPSGWQTQSENSKQWKWSYQESQYQPRMRSNVDLLHKFTLQTSLSMPRLLWLQKLLLTHNLLWDTARGQSFILWTLEKMQLLTMRDSYSHLCCRPMTRMKALMLS